MATQVKREEKSFLWRRIHSLMGLWLILYLIEHLIVNSQAALWLKEDGIGFVRLVNLLESLPYLHIVEVLLIGLPLAVHMYWGVKRALQPKSNCFSSDATQPQLGYGRNRAFTWQRISSWVLLIGIFAHVIQMRFVQFPEKVGNGFQAEYVTTLTKDAEIEKIAKRIGVKVKALSKDRYEVRSDEMGKTMLLMVRDTFKSPLMALLYTVFVLAAAFHAFNGLWTALITWGVMLSVRSQKAMLPICWFGTLLLAVLGLASIWGSYWLSIRA